jgi:7 transmembrane receptor (rhodopsin family)
MHFNFHRQFHDVVPFLWDNIFYMYSHGYPLRFYLQHNVKTGKKLIKPIAVLANKIIP